MPAELENEKQVPESINYIWVWWLELNSARQSNGFGPSALSFSEILAWTTLTKRELQAWEVEAIRDIDLIYIQEAFTENEQ